MTSDSISLKATVREETGKKVNTLRKQGKIPAVLYGHKIKPINLAIDYITFDKLYKQAGESTLVDLVINEDKPVKVLIQDYQEDPVSSRFIHVDFHQVNMSEKINTDIVLKFINEAPAVKELSGVLIKNITSLDVECLPGDLIHEIVVDLSSIKTFDDIIHVKDVKVPATLTIKNKPDDVVVQVQAQREEEVPVEAPVAAAPAEVVGAKEAVAEGEAAATDKKEDKKADKKS